MAAKPVAIITGGTRGIGQGIAKALAGQGFDLLLGFGSNAEAAEQHAKELEAESGAQVRVVGGDIADEEVIKKYFEVLAAEFPGRTLRALVHNAGQYVGVTATNNAGIAPGPPKVLGNLLSADGGVNLQEFDYYHKMYARAWVQLIERAAPLLPDGEGTIIGISGCGCNSTQRPRETYDLPGTGKTVMETSARYYAKNLAKRRITVNVVIPGITESDAWNCLAKAKGKGSGEVPKNLSHQVAESACPMKVSQTAQQLGEVVAWLCGPQARYITGVALPVDGGLHLT